MINYGANLTMHLRKMAPLDEEKSAVPPSQIVGTPIPHCRSEIGGIGL
jgi:hypothetical protein